MDLEDFYIKNMVCQRCVKAVELAFKARDIDPLEIGLGLVKCQGPVSGSLRAKLSLDLSVLGFELLDDARAANVERIKKVVLERVHHSPGLGMKVNWSILVSSALGQDYKQLSNLFSAVEGMTLEQYIIRQKVERIKELLFYDQMNINEISYHLDYSSVQHLSAQFKKITGQTPTQFKSSRSAHASRRFLDDVG
ncbi:MAG: AraC family transcriptional regulator [Pedobacter sp.]|nr:MAG: AraC family transcriptional regulator [Pedobacter sp.]